MELTERAQRDADLHEQRKTELSELKRVLERSQARYVKLEGEHEEQEATVVLVRYDSNPTFCTHFSL